MKPTAVKIFASRLVTGPSVCANRDEKNHLAAVTAGFALTITAWVAGLSLMPADWLDPLSAAPAWSYCLGSVGLWAALSRLMYYILAPLTVGRMSTKR